MLIVAPQIISILSHVTVLLFAILVAILSAWTVRRVRKASARSPFEFFPPVFADHKPVRRASERTIRSLPTTPVCKRSLSQGSILHIDTQPGSPFGILARPQLPPVRQHRSYSVSPSCVSEQESEKSEQSAYSWNEADSEFGRWLIGNEKECNSPTGSLLDELDESDWLPSLSASARRRRRTGRRIIAILGIVRVMIAIPVVMLYAEYGASGVSCLRVNSYRLRVLTPASHRKIQFATALLLNYDLLLLDFAISFSVSRNYRAMERRRPRAKRTVALQLALAPLVVCLWRLRLRLPRSWEHHVYFTSLM